MKEAGRRGARNGQRRCRKDNPKVWAVIPGNAVRCVASNLGRRPWLLRGNAAGHFARCLGPFPLDPNRTGGFRSDWGCLVAPAQVCEEWAASAQITATP